MAKLTVRALDAAKPKDKPYKLTVDKGLYIRVAMNGEKRWIIRYVVDGKQIETRLPEPYGTGAGFKSLADATTENARVQALARGGVDFVAKRQKDQANAQAEELKADKAVKAAEKAESLLNLTIQDLYDTWINEGVFRKDGNAALRRSMEKDILPVIGKTPVRSLTEKQIRDAYLNVIKRGVERTAVDLSNSIGQMMRWADKRQPWRGLLILGNPAQLVDVKKLVSHDYTEERDRVLSPVELKALYHRFETVQAEYDAAPCKYDVERPILDTTRLSIWICLGTLCRIGELLTAEWKHVDLVNRERFIPAENTKAHRGKKQDQRIYLSDFALRQFQALEKITGTKKWLFPATNLDEGHVCLKSVSKQIGDRQMKFKDRKALSQRVNNNSLVVGDGAWTPHDMRRTGATMMQKLGVSLDVIDRCQNHIIAGSKVRRHYLHYEYATEKKDAWAKLGDRIDAILLTNDSTAAEQNEKA